MGTYKALSSRPGTRIYGGEASIVRPISPDTRWSEYAKTETVEYREIQPESWVPRRALREFPMFKRVRSQGPGRNSGGVERLSSVDWAVHPKTSGRLIHLHFPEGLSIDDDRHSDRK